MKKIIFGIFAHPDDEAFGPSGTFLTETKNGAELHLITFTLGDAGTNLDNHPNLAEIREQEWRKGGELMGATSMHFLGYKDGMLNNHTLIEAGAMLVELISKLVSERNDIDEIEFVSMDLNGVTGHIDHIVAARAACWAFYQLKAQDSRVSRIRLACLPHEQVSASNTNWLYMEAGRTANEIDEIVDARQYHDEIIAIMRAHHTQRSDGESHIERLGDQLGMNYFVVKN